MLDQSKLGGHRPLLQPILKPLLGKFLQRVGDGGFDLARAVATQFAIHFLETADEVEDLFARIRPAGSIAKMRATAEGSVGVDHAFAGVALEQRTSAVGRFGELLAPRGAETFCGDERFALREVRRLAGELEAATLGAGQAKAFHWSPCQFCIHRPDFFQGVLYLVPPHVVLKFRAI